MVKGEDSKMKEDLYHKSGKVGLEWLSEYPLELFACGR